MDCKESQPLLNAYVDGELDLVRHVEVETHLKTCASCTRVVEDLRASRSVFRAHLPRYTASRELNLRIQNSLPDKKDPPAESLRAVIKPSRLPFLRWGGATVALAAAVCLGFFLGVNRTQINRVEEEALSAHVRSLMGNHITDVTSTDQHTVKPWFAGKLDFSPPVIDLAADDFPLLGGRLDQIDHRSAAALVYRRRQHTINLFIWPKSPNDSAAHSFQTEGYRAISWSQGGLNYLAISDVAEPDLQAFVSTYRRHTS
jgi:anti-sigma factor RsiW